MTNDAGGPAVTGYAPRPVRPRPGGRPAPARRASPQLSVVALAGALVLVGLVVAWLGQRSAAAASARPVVAWAFSPASNTVTVRLTPGGGPAARRILVHSRLTVSGGENGRRGRRSADGRMIRVPVPPGEQTSLVVQVMGPRPFSRTLTVTVPPALRVVTSHHSPRGVLVSVSSPLRPRHRPLCGTDKVSFPASSEVAVGKSPDACRARLRLTARDGEQVVVPVAVPALPEVPLYAFASPAGQAIYITVDDGWTPSPEVLTIMRRSHLPVTAFLIGQAVQRDLPYWRAFVQAGGTVEDHTVSHPDLTKQTLGQATTQWGQARRTLGRWLGRTPLMGRPPYGDFDPMVQAAAYRGGLKSLVGWSATMDSGRIRTWDGKGLEPGEIVLLHWVPGLGHELTKLLAAIHASHLHVMPLTRASFAGIAPQRHSLGGD